MAPSRGRARGGAVVDRASRQSTRSTPKAKDATSDVYQDMLSEAAVVDPEPTSDRPLKRRRLVREVSIPTATPSRAEQPPAHINTGNEASEAAAGLQTAQLSSDDEDESDFSFEDVDLGGSSNGIGLDDAEIGDISIPIDQNVTPKRKTPTKRKPATSVEKARRLLVHKAHILCLLSHCIYVNSWINAVASDDSIAPKLAGNAKKSFTVRQGAGQFEQNKTFMKGLQNAVEDFSTRYTVTSSGMRRAQWDAGPDDKVDIEPLDKAEFFRAARKMQGSQDTGNQLFCAMLRSIGVEARMVCSLQPLPFASVATKGATPQKVVKRTVHAVASDIDPNKGEVGAHDSAMTTSRTIGRVPSARRRLGQPSFSPATVATISPPKPEREVRKLSYPVFWVEAFDDSHQKWIPVDPTVTRTMNKALGLEPPGSYEHNQLSYAIAFEANCVAKDVTRRYARAYNAKTRRQRVERTGDSGHAWWEKTMRFFRRRGGHSDRDQVEDAELAQKEAKEGMPANVQDFKDHPVYALERHLKRHEVIHPRREVGKANAGTAKNPRMEAVFRRKDVLVCKSADKWYRSGRVVKEGEQPRQHLSPVARQRRRTPIDEEDETAETQRRTALYSLDQTEVYVPPPVSASGKITRNAFGNLDIYVPSMVPAGGVHIRHPLTTQAAQILKIDAADAVVGFSFKGRQGTAVIGGAVVAERFAAAVRAVIEGLEWEAEEERGLQRSLVALKLWKRFLTGMKVKERVAAYGPSNKQDGKGDLEEQEFVEDATGLLLGSSDGGEETEEGWPSAGKYGVEDLLEMLDEAKKARKRAAGAVKGKRKRFDSDDEDEDPGTAQTHDDGEVGDGGFMAEDAENSVPTVSLGSGGFVIEDDGGGGGFVAEDDEPGVEGGGFVVDGEDGGGGGGFMVDDVADSDKADEEPGGFIADRKDDVNAPEGAGFIPDAIDAGHHADDEGDGGGFISNEPNQQDVSSEPPAVDDPFHTGTAAVTNVGGGEVVMHGALPTDKSPDPAALSTSPEPTTVTIQNDGGASDMLGTIELEDGGKAVLGEDGDKEDAGREQDEDDNGSLLSHDPEDDDAEPDWLESD
ncbi:Rad4 beta-hairpin domain 1 [Teratosphaeria destructans]|uniref:Rad4 beta-hairpin domain 1 n=1 Tax=Teratosphaeria destructans TaxID=418781 RepID=A0A9W7SW13_9PEZI|nr:Rad4 beta-hairpin domain 1 [Teratosphaeria destructans]